MRVTFELFVLIGGGLFLLVVLPMLGAFFWGVPGFVGGLALVALVVAIDFERWMSRHHWVGK